MKNLEEMASDYDWQEAMSCASLQFDDVMRVISSDEGENDGDPWVAVFLMKDGTFARISSWCDYTGWDCQSGGDCKRESTFKALVNLALTPDERERLHLELIV
jgi:hypothetical protein